jgi:hypothetical protein
MMSMPRVLSPAISVLVAIPQLIKHPSSLVSSFPFPQEVTSPNGWARRVRNSIDQVSQNVAKARGHWPLTARPNLKCPSSNTSDS